MNYARSYALLIKRRHPDRKERGGSSALCDMTRQTSLNGAGWDVAELGPRIWTTAVYLLGSEGKTPIRATLMSNGCFSDEKWVGGWEFGGRGNFEKSV